jgi:hypothetical protein
MPITIGEAMARLARERGDDPQRRQSAYDSFLDSLRAAFVPSNPLPPEERAILLAVLQERRDQGLPPDLHEELDEFNRRLVARALASTGRGKGGNVSPTVVRRPKEYADEPALHGDLSAACNEAWRKNGERRNPTMSDALTELQLMPGSRGISPKTLQRNVRDYYGGWGKWLIIWREERRGSTS